MLSGLLARLCRAFSCCIYLAHKYTTRKTMHGTASRRAGGDGFLALSCGAKSGVNAVLQYLLTVRVNNSKMSQMCVNEQHFPAIVFTYIIAL